MILDIGPGPPRDRRHPGRGYDSVERAGGGVRVRPVRRAPTLSLAIARSHAFSLAGGGDTLAAIDKFAIADKVSYISTGGGAFLEYVEGKTLPAVAMLQQRAAAE